MAVAGTAPIIRAKRSRGASCAGSEGRSVYRGDRDFDHDRGLHRGWDRTAGMTTIEHPRVDEGLPYGSPFPLRRSPAARPELLYCSLRKTPALAEARRLEFRAVIIILILEIDG